MPEENDREKKEIRMNDMFETPILDDMVQSPAVKAFKVIAAVVDGPVEWIRHNVVEKYRGPKQYYYHKRFRRVPTVDQCYTDDQACIYEANEQYKRDKKVDGQIINILRYRFVNCTTYVRNVNDFSHLRDNIPICVKEKKDYDDAQLNYYIKYGDLGHFHTVVDAFMKQKHRLIFERREAEKKAKAGQ
ncbi:NADH dehydrogenase [ubiquinone] 1 beta subcomplex subunit 10-like [Oppia nitens]|uniref:NADH dehydrogenase [ubiquinone] 1 beta subcomplex subunit 10-like n=1 Tax=Oppia nitens TaxID=1686743 RepID=UPI0023DAFDBE|nr:NADH dehydrogenase [ubiquinone] 1 beta subcomplex subunit 10-like [Oppia nitens]